MSVSMNPGAIALAVMPLAATSRARLFMKPIMPAFAEYVWSAFGLTFQDPVRKVLPWPAEGERLVPAGTRLPESVARLFQPVDG